MNSSSGDSDGSVGVGSRNAKI